MKKNILGKTGIEVSELCFGTLPMGPLQTNMPLEDGVNMLLLAMESGINFFDSAQLYQTYPYMLGAMKRFGSRSKDLILTSKSLDTSYEGMEKAVLEAIRELERDYIDIFFLHAGRSDENLFTEWEGAMECLIRCKEKGLIRAVGVAAHHVKATEKAAMHPDVDIVFPLINKKGVGIVGGSRDEMLAAMEIAHRKGKGQYAMKSLGGGCLINELPAAVNYVRDLSSVDAVAVGMVSNAELDMHLRIFNGETISKEEMAKLKTTKKLLVFELLCGGCGSCVEACPNQALSLKNGKASVDVEKCALCGYCTPACPELALRLR